MSLSDIGRIFGQDHTTVLNSIQMKQRRRRNIIGMMSKQYGKSLTN